MPPATNARIQHFGISAQALKAGSAPAYAGWTLEVEARPVQCTARPVPGAGLGRLEEWPYAAPLTI
jgi:hypothetical protein